MVSGCRLGAVYRVLGTNEFPVRGYRLQAMSAHNSQFSSKSQESFRDSQYVSVFSQQCFRLANFKEPAPTSPTSANCEGPGQLWPPTPESTPPCSPRDFGPSFCAFPGAVWLFLWTWGYLTKVGVASWASLLYGMALFSEHPPTCLGASLSIIAKCFAPNACRQVKSLRHCSGQAESPKPPAINPLLSFEDRIT